MSYPRGDRQEAPAYTLDTPSPPPLDHPDDHPAPAPLPTPVVQGPTRARIDPPPPCDHLPVLALVLALVLAAGRLARRKLLELVGVRSPSRDLFRAAQEGMRRADVELRRADRARRGRLGLGEYAEPRRDWTTETYR